MYSLKIIKPLRLEDGRIFLAGETATGLTSLEVRQLMQAYPKNFEAGDEITRLLIESFQA